MLPSTFYLVPGITPAFLALPQWYWESSEKKMFVEMLINLIIKNDTWNESFYGFQHRIILSNRSIEPAVGWTPLSERLAQPMSSFSFQNFSFNTALAYTVYILNLLSWISEMLFSSCCQIFHDKNSQYNYKSRH